MISITAQNRTKIRQCELEFRTHIKMSYQQDIRPSAHATTRHKCFDLNVSICRRLLSSRLAYDPVGGGDVMSTRTSSYAEEGSSLISAYATVSGPCILIACDDWFKLFILCALLDWASICDLSNETFPIKKTNLIIFSNFSTVNKMHKIS